MQLMEISDAEFMVGQRSPRSLVPPYEITQLRRARRRRADIVNTKFEDSSLVGIEHGDA